MHVLKFDDILVFNFFHIITLCRFFGYRPGTTVVRDKIFGIEQRYFLVYFNGLLLYIFLLALMEDSVSVG